MDIKAQLRHARISPQKARLVADLIRGRDVNEALNLLAFTRKKAAGMMQKLLKSAVANAEENHKVLDVDDLRVKTVTVDGGAMLKRWMPRARGSASPIRKRTSHITIVLNER
ncbi:MAG: 50S ribosomal protein L22 [Nitrospinaceae bacterium]